MRLLITGGAGYIGSHANRLLHEKGVETVVIDDLSDGHAEAVICGRFVKGNFGDKELVNRLMKELRFDAVLHFGAFASVPDSVALLPLQPSANRSIRPWMRIIRKSRSIRMV